MAPEKLESAASRPLLGSAETQRLCIALIGAEQDKLLREGRITHDQCLRARLSRAGAPRPGDIVVDEETLGFDSLSLLDLVMSVTRFFGLAASGIEDYLLVQRRLGDWADLTAKHFELVGSAAEIAFTTSGSTGAGKTIPHRGDTLEAEVSANAAALIEREGTGCRILSMVSPMHIYGFLWSCLLPRRMGVESVDLFASAPTAVIRTARPGDIILGTPFTWAKLARSEQALPANVVGVTAGGASTAETWSAARTLGLARLIDIYGATETGGIGLRSQEGAPFELMSHLVRLGDDPGRPDGTVLDLQDRLDWTGDRQFRVLGRRDSVVQVAGTNVCPEEVRRLLIGEPGVRDVAIRLDGERLKAFVVPASPAAPNETLERTLRTLAARSLPPPARPDRFTFGPELPRSTVGKLADW